MFIKLKNKFKYNFDNFMAKGPLALIGGLSFFTAIFVFAVGIFIKLFNLETPEGEYTFCKTLWVSFLHTFNQGMLTEQTEPFGYVATMFIVTIVGIFSLSMLVSILTNAQNDKLQKLRQGRSIVVEEGHTLILGWSNQVIPVLRELNNKAQKDGRAKRQCVVILGDMDKSLMEDAIREERALSCLKVVCRNGTPYNTRDLEIVSLSTARTILIISPDTDDPDIAVIKTLMAIRNQSDFIASAGKKINIVAELCDRTKKRCAEIAARPLEVDFLMRDDFLSRIIAQTCRQPGLSNVYLDLLCFKDGSDVVFEEFDSEAIGLSFGDTVKSIRKSILFGLWDSNTGKTVLNPPHETVITKDFVGIFLQNTKNKDDNTDHGQRTVLYDDNSCKINLCDESKGSPERTLVLGWNSKGTRIIEEIDKYVGNGSYVKVVSKIESAADEINVLNNLLVNTDKIDFTCADSTQRETLRACDPSSFNHVIVLSCDDAETENAADTRAIMTLLYLSDLCPGKPKTTWPPFSVVSEMKDDLHRRLADGFLANDFVVSNRLSSLILAQFCEDHRRKDVFKDFLDEDGQEIYLKLAARYNLCNRRITFNDVVYAALLRNEIAFGYMKEVKDKSGIVNKIWLNPSRDSELKLGRWDRVITLALDER